MKNLPIFIPTFNNPSHLKTITSQLFKLQQNNLIVLDNGSSFPKMLHLLNQLQNSGVKVVYLYKNLGPRYFVDSGLYRIIEDDYFVLTDPDLSLNDSTPINWDEILIEISESHNIGKVGFSLTIQDNSDLFVNHQKVINDERQYWINEIGTVEYENKIAPYYHANIDTTFALYNKKFFNYVYGQSMHTFYNAIRVAGDFQCKHVPWYKNDGFEDDEREFYIKSAVYSSGYSDTNVNPYSSGRI